MRLWWFSKLISVSYKLGLQYALLRSEVNANGSECQDPDPLLRFPDPGCLRALRAIKGVGDCFLTSEE